MLRIQIHKPDPVSNTGSILVMAFDLPLFKTEDDKLTKKATDCLQTAVDYIEKNTNHIFVVEVTS